MGAKQSIDEAKYGHNTNAESVGDDYSSSCDGKFVIITGGNSGIGLETARVLSKNGAKVVLCSRSTSNGDEAAAKIKGQHPNADITVMQLDLASFKSIRSFAAEYKAKNKPLNILINNAGIMACPKSETVDGFESQFGVNHLGHFLLTSELLPLLISSGTKEVPSRVVNLSSAANWLISSQGGIRFDDLSATLSYNPWERYGESKLANILFAKELNKRMATAGHNVISMALHPGVIMSTGLNKDYSLSHGLIALSAIWNRAGSFRVFLSDTGKTIPQGASTTVFAALSPEVTPGAYYSDCAVSTLVHEQANDDNAAQRLWEVSEQMIASK